MTAAESEHGASQTDAPAGALPPAGWYPDPGHAGRQRWWDGAQWTDQVHPPYPGQPAYQPAVDQTWVAARAASEARQWAMFAHLSALVGLVTALPWLGPLIIYLVKKDSDPFAAEHAREALNFNISVFIYLVVGTFAMLALALVLIGLLLIPVLIAIVIAWFVFVIVAAVRANGGHHYRYPLTIRLVG